ncbi:transposase [Treponema endosymbiont of Eucomonympha sp.]|uniref:transposase n=1 Tax=Treponema endosymbiont of Eucomonympha sp. TaxID=1580831 RepID=UPI0007517A62|nr:transposase [Treponema endosymbiont of Eucomonympha sp.]
MQERVLWWALPEKFGKWHTIYVRFSRRTKNVVWEQVAAKRSRSEGSFAGFDVGQGTSRCSRGIKEKRKVSD